MRFEDSTCLVTGATGGIGSATARRFADEGAQVALHTAHRPDRAKELAEDLPGGPHPVLQADLLDAEALTELADEAWQTTGGVDVLVNNAGLYEEHPPAETQPEDWRDSWRRTLALNLEAPAQLCQLLGRRMAEQGGGAIVNVSSRGAFRGEPDAPAYGASKAGLNALTQSLAKALGADGVTVTAVAPGFVDTPMVADLLDGETGDAIRAQSPMDRVAQPEEVAATIAFLASDEAPYASGTIVDVNGASYLRS